MTINIKVEVKVNGPNPQIVKTMNIYVYDNINLTQYTYVTERKYIEYGTHIINT